MSANTTDNDRRYRTRNSTIPTARDDYNGNSAQVNLTQPLWRYANIVGVRQADAAMAQAQQQLTGVEQDLFAKLVASWFDLLAARDNIEFTQQQVLVTRRQSEIARRGLEFGITGIPQAYEAKARYDQAMADASLAHTDAQIRFATLEQLVGRLAFFPPPYMRDNATLIDLSADQLESWLTTVEASNPNILAAQHAFEAAATEIRKQKAGHHPTLDVVATYGNNAQGVGGFPGQNGYDIRQRSLGLQLNIPLYSGGTQSAKVAEAVAMREKARADIQAARRNALLSAKQGWFGWQAASAKAQAGRRSAEAARLALKAAQAGAMHGLKSELEVLQAEQQLYEGLRDLRKGCYDQIVFYIKLKATAGQLAQADVTALDALFEASPEKPLSLPAELRSGDREPGLLPKTSLALSE